MRFSYVRESTLTRSVHVEDQKATDGMPSASSSSSRMMIRGVTISIKLLVVRPMPMLRNRRSIIGILDRTGTPYSVRVSFECLDAAQEDRAAVGDRHGRGDRGGGGIGELNRGLRSTPRHRQDRYRRRHRDGNVKVVKPLFALKNGLSVIRT